MGSLADTIIIIIAAIISVAVFVIALAFITDSKQSTVIDKLVNTLIVAAGIAGWMWSVIYIAIPVANGFVGN